MEYEQWDGEPVGPLQAAILYDLNYAYFYEDEGAATIRDIARTLKVVSEDREACGEHPVDYGQHGIGVALRRLRHRGFVESQRIFGVSCGEHRPRLMWRILVPDETLT